MVGLLWTKAAAVDELWEEAGTPVLEVVFIFFQSTVYRDNGRGPISGAWRSESSGEWHKLLAWRMVWERRVAIYLKWSWHVHGLDSTCCHAFKIAAGKVGGRWWNQFEIRPLFKGQNAPFALQLTEETIKGSKRLCFFYFGMYLIRKYTLNLQVGHNWSSFHHLQTILCRTVIQRWAVAAGIRVDVGPTLPLPPNMMNDIFYLIYILILDGAAFSL